MERLSAIRPLAPRDLDAVLAIQSAAPEIARWSRGDYERACAGKEGADPLLRGWVSEQGSVVAGFLVARLVADEVEILNLAVAPEARRRGLATRLLEDALAQARGSGRRRVFLEVRESNAGAIAFYRCRGFAPSGRRMRYYSGPSEDALVLARFL